MTNQDTFKRFISRKVKVVYKEYDAMQIGKGILVSFNDKHIILDGDVSEQLIPIDSIIKLSAMKSNHGKKNGSREMGSRV